MPVKKVTSTVKVTSNKEVTKKPATKKIGGLVVPAYSLVGKETGTLDLPKDIFGAKVSKDLLAQAMRVYMYNKKIHSASTKTRGEVHGTTAKWFRQKGTGRARHGAQTAPIFVGGGVAFGPKPKDVSLNLPKKMKKAAIISALSDKALDSDIMGLLGVEKASGKTKEMATLLKKIADKKSVLIVTDQKQETVARGVRNLKRVDVLPVGLLNAYEILRHQVLMVTQGAVNVLSGKQMPDKAGKK